MNEDNEENLVATQDDNHMVGSYPPPNLTTVFQNMQHAIVFALNQLAPFSTYHDGSIRMKELYTQVKDCKIQVGEFVDNGPHRFSIFNSALSGRRSATELFERVDEIGRQGAWYKLARSYDECLALALEQKGMKKIQQRVRNKPEPPAQPEIAHVKPQHVFKWNKTEVIDILNQIKQLAIKTSELKEENRILEEKKDLLTEEMEIMTGSLKEQDQTNYRLEQLEAYIQADEYRKALRKQVEEAQNNLITISNQSFEFQK